MDILTSSFIGNTNLQWLPMTIGILIVLIGCGVGFLNGWKGSLVFMTLNIAFALATIFSFTPLYNLAINILGDFISLGGGGEISLSDIAPILKPTFGVLYLIGGFVWANVISTIIILTFIEFFKGKMWDNKEMEKSNISVRMGGLTMGLFTAVQPALMFSYVVSIPMESNWMTKYPNVALRESTFLQIGDTDAGKDDIITTLAIAQNYDRLDLFFDLVTGEAFPDYTDPVTGDQDRLDLYLEIRELNTLHTYVERALTSEATLDFLMKSVAKNAAGEIMVDKDPSIFQAIKDATSLETDPENAIQIRPINMTGKEAENLKAKLITAFGITEEADIVKVTPFVDGLIDLVIAVSDETPETPPAAPDDTPETEE